jgi:hypothetical protein
MPKRSSKSKREDVNQAAARIVAQSTDEPPLTPEETTKRKNPAAVALGRLGGKKGGPARAASLSSDQRKAIARKAAQTRWQREKGGS